MDDARREAAACAHCPSAMLRDALAVEDWLAPYTRGHATISVQLDPPSWAEAGCLDARTPDPANAPQPLPGALQATPRIVRAGETVFVLWPIAPAVPWALPAWVGRLGGYCMATAIEAAHWRHDRIGAAAWVRVVDHINWSGRNPLIGLSALGLDPAFLDIAATYDADLRSRQGTIDNDTGIPCGYGVYLGLPDDPSQTAVPQGVGAIADVSGTLLVPEILAAAWAEMPMAAYVRLQSHTRPDSNPPPSIADFLEFCSLFHCQHY